MCVRAPEPTPIHGGLCDLLRRNIRALAHTHSKIHTDTTPHQNHAGMRTRILSIVKHSHAHAEMCAPAHKMLKVYACAHHCQQNDDDDGDDEDYCVCVWMQQVGFGPGSRACCLRDLRSIFCARFVWSFFLFVSRVFSVG